MIIVVFAVVVIGGMGSIMGWVVTGFILGLLEGLTKVFYPEASKHHHLRGYGGGAFDQAGRVVRTGKLRTACCN